MPHGAPVRQHRPPPRRGSVLVLVLFVLAVLSLAAVSLAHRTALNRRAIDDQVDLITSRARAESVAAQVLHALAADDNAFDHPAEAWGSFNTHRGQLSHATPNGLTCRVTDEEGKLNIQSATAATLDALGMTRRQRDSLLDWIDEDDAPRAEGAERRFYGRRVPPYLAKNAPIETIEELSAVRGFDISAATGAATGAGQGIEHWSDLLTPFGDGRINLNSAPQAVLETLPIRRDAVDQILAFRAHDRESHGPLEEHAFRAAEDVLRLQGLDEADRSVLLATTTFQSHFYRIVVEARSARPGRRYRIAALVHADRGRVKVLQWLSRP